MADYLSEATKIESEIIDWRRDFHRNPELSFEEVRTAGIVADFLAQLGLEVRTKVGKTGVVGLLRGAHPGPTILMRFDMDALPMQEANQTDYASIVPNVMHSCGHDTHVAMGMGTARLLAAHRDDLHGNVKFMFQPAEENGGGAAAMIADGVLENPRPQMSFGIHIHSQTPSGVFGIADGAVLSAADTFYCKITGKGGHGAEPHATIDPVVTTAQIINLLQTIVSRNVNPFDPVSISIGSIHAGTAFNIIPHTAEMKASIRTYRPETRLLVLRRIREIIEGTAQLMGAQADLVMSELLPATINDPVIAAQVRTLATKIVGKENIDPENRSTASEDFSLVLREVPGVYIVVGAARKPGDYPHHNPLFDIDESTMKLGVALMCDIAAYYLSPSSPLMAA